MYFSNRSSVKDRKDEAKEILLIFYPFFLKKNKCLDDPITFKSIRFKLAFQLISFDLFQIPQHSTIYIDWNGKDNAGRDLNASTYYYVAKVVFDVVDPKKQHRTLKGWVTIMR